MFIWLTAFLVSFLLCFFFISIFLLDVFVRCGDHAPLYNLFNVILKNLGMFNVNSFCHLHSFFARCFYPFVEFFVLRKQKRNKLPTTTKHRQMNCLRRVQKKLKNYLQPHQQIQPRAATALGQLCYGHFLGNTFLHLLREKSFLNL